MNSPPNLLLVALSVTIVGQVIYHTVMKVIGRDLSPFQVIAAAYFFALVAAIVIGHYSKTFTGANLLTGLLIGLAVLAVELGYIYSYRFGLPISIGALGVLVATTLFLIPIGMLVFSESISMRTIMGIILAIIGVWLIRNPS